MKSKKAKALKKTVSVVKTLPPEKCWYCGDNADTGAQAAFVLTRPNEEFNYFAPSLQSEKNYSIMQIEIPRCVECRTAHLKVDHPVWSMLFYCLIACALLGVYLGIFRKALAWWSYLAIGLGVSGAVIGIAFGVRHKFFVLPDHIKESRDVEKHPKVQELRLKGWTFKVD